MKSVTSILLGISSTILLCACADETGEPLTKLAEPIHFKSLSTAAANKANPYDYFGVQYVELLETYKMADYQPSDFADVDALVQTLMCQASSTQSLPSKQGLLSSCVNNPMQTLDNLLTAPYLSADAKNILSGFAEDFTTLSAVPFVQAYTAITTIENTVINSGTMSPEDQRVILTIASILRYSLYHSCCEDTDWGKSVGNIVAATAGAIERSDLTVEYALITSIAGLEKIQI